MQNFEMNYRNQDGSSSIPEGIYKVQIIAHNSQNKERQQSQIYNVNRIQQAMKNGDFILGNNQKITLQDIIAIQAQPTSLKDDLYNRKMKINDLISE